MHPALAALADSLPPPDTQRLQSELLQQHGINLLVLRTDSIHPEISGNKWYKLKYNLDACLQQGHNTVLTFGGAWSNHIHATAAAAKALGLNSIGMIRGEPVHNSNLVFAREQGMRLSFINRERYRHKHETGFIDSLHQQFGDFYLIPEGGSNALAHRGVQEMLAQLDTSGSQVVCACGTGATVAGIVSGVADDCEVIGIPVLKAHDSLHQHIDAAIAHKHAHWRLQIGYEFGGYARVSDKLLSFMSAFKIQFGIELDAVYTAKMFYALFDMISRGHFDTGSRIIAIHTGGLQGNDGFRDRIAACMPAAHSVEACFSH